MGSIEVDSTALATTHPLKIFDACRKKNKFVYACAPMVRYSKLAFRQTVHHYGVDLCWTPMILAKEFNRSSFARDSDLTIGTAGPQPVTILQFGANDPTELSRAAALAAPSVSGVDLNCGCPQGWACAETLGAALMDRRELVRDMVVATRGRLARDGWDVGLDADRKSPRGRSVSVKIRVHSDLRKTMDFIDTVIGDPHRRNIDWLTIHPRTRHTPSTTPIRADALDILTERYAGTLPILLSGDVFDLSALPVRPVTAAAPELLPSTLTVKDDDHPAATAPTPANTRLAGFMAARGLLANPALFAGHPACPWEAVERFACRAARAPLPLKLAVHHVQEMCGPGLGPDKGALLSRRERQAFARMTDVTELMDFLDDKIAEHKGQTTGLRRDL